MFSSSNEKNQISKVFGDLTTNQKMSIINLLLSIALCDQDLGDRNKEMNCLNIYSDILDVKSDLCLTYYAKGFQIMINDLKILNENQKDFLIVAAFEMITCDTSPNEIELAVTEQLFEQIGVEWSKVLRVIEKAGLFLKP